MVLSPYPPSACALFYGVKSNIRFLSLYFLISEETTHLQLQFEGSTLLFQAVIFTQKYRSLAVSVFCRDISFWKGISRACVLQSNITFEILMGINLFPAGNCYLHSKVSNSSRFRFCKDISMVVKHDTFIVYCHVSTLREVPHGCC